LTDLCIGVVQSPDARVGASRGFGDGSEDDLRLPVKLIQSLLIELVDDLQVSRGVGQILQPFAHRLAIRVLATAEPEGQVLSRLHARIDSELLCCLEGLAGRGAELVDRLHAVVEDA